MRKPVLRPPAQALPVSRGRRAGAAAGPGVRPAYDESTVMEFLYTHPELFATIGQIADQQAQLQARLQAGAGY